MGYLSERKTSSSTPWYLRLTAMVLWIAAGFGLLPSPGLALESAGLTTPGTTDYPNGGMRRVDGWQSPGEGAVKCGVLDPETGYAYLGTSVIPARILKVAVGDGDTSPVLLGSLTLAPEEREISTAALDSAKGYAYFGTSGYPSHIIKIALGEGSAPPVRVSSIQLIDDDGDLLCSAVDSSNGYLYFGSRSLTATYSPRLVKVRAGIGNAPPERIAAVDFPELGSSGFGCGVIEAANGYGYFGTDEYNQARIAKVALGEGDAAPATVGTVELLNGEERLSGAAIDPDRGLAYFAGGGKIVKISTGVGAAPPTRIGVVNSNLAFSRLLMLDPEEQSLFAVSDSLVVRLKCGGPSVPPEEVARTQLFNDVGSLATGVIDPTRNSLCLWRSPRSLLNASYTAIETTGVVLGGEKQIGDIGESLFSANAIDPRTGYTYFGTWSNPARIVKAAPRNADSPFRRVSATTLSPGDSQITDLFVDPGSRMAYAVCWNPGGIVKLTLGEGEEPPSRIGRILFNNENRIESAVVDADFQYALVGTSVGYLDRIIKVKLGSGAELPSRLGALALAADEVGLNTAVLDPTTGYAYFGTYGGKVVKVSMGTGDELPTRVGVLTLPDGEVGLSSAVIDPERGFAYFAGYQPPGRIFKVALGEGSSPPTFVGTLELPEDEWWFLDAEIDTESNCAYFVKYLRTAKVVKVSLGDGFEPPQRVGAITLPPTEGYLHAITRDPSSGCLYVGSFTSLASAASLSTDQRNAIRATRFSLAKTTYPTEMRFFSHHAGGHLRFAIYDNAEPRTLLWESPEIPNAGDDSEVIVPISDGTPTSLSLAPGDYWLTWQTDSKKSVGSYTAGATGEGWLLDHEFGPAPASIASTEVVNTAERWTQSISYALEPLPTPSPSPSPTATPTVTPTASPTHAPHATHTPHHTPHHTHTPHPSHTPAIDHTPHATHTPAASHTPHPTHTPAPTHALHPTATPGPS